MMGYEDSLNEIKGMLRKVTRPRHSTMPRGITILGYRDAVEEMKSSQREEAKRLYS